jgi:phosphotransferase family enzyme
VRGVPLVIARAELGGRPVTVEAAMRGELLGRALERSSPGRALAALDRAGAWAVELGVRTSGGPASLAVERDRLGAELTHVTAASGLVRQLPAVPAVLAHNDLGTWNVLVTDDAVSAVDWESARAAGFPLWDLLYLLTDGLALVDGATSHADRAAHAVALHRGELAASSWFFGRVLRGADSLGVGVDAVGGLATLCWLHHSLSRPGRLGRGVGAGTAELPAAARLSQPWLTDPLLGPGWTALRGHRP